MYNFKDDYSEGAHPNILKALLETNLSQQMGYGEDEICKKAVYVIKEKLQRKNIDIHFVSGGTQANLIVLSSILKSYESVISANSGHIFTHEAGAIEVTGHKVNSIQTSNGKITTKQINDVINEHKKLYEHMVKPKVVFISQSTEIGTIYLKKELENIYNYCKKNNLLLYLDGARIGSALSSSKNDLSLSDIVDFTDIFYIGGTKNGALLGEAIIISNNDLKKDFRIHMKQRGALLAKGRILGIQFLELFKNNDNLFFDIAKHANNMAVKLTQGIKELHYKFFSESPTNQIFPIFPNSIIKQLQKKYGFYIWSKEDATTSAIRLVTSWATKEDKVDEFIADLKRMEK